MEVNSLALAAWIDLRVSPLCKPVSAAGTIEPACKTLSLEVLQVI